MTGSEEFVVVQIAGNEPETELVCGLLRSAGIECVARLTNRGAGAGDGLGTAGPHEILVRQRDAEDARELLAGDQG